MHNVVDITSKKNIEVAVRIHTDVENTDHEFYTDLNGFQVKHYLSYCLLDSLFVLAPSAGGLRFNIESRTASYQRRYKNGTSSSLV